MTKLHALLHEVAQRQGLFWVNTVDDTFMAVANLDDDQSHDHAVRAACFALDALEALSNSNVHLHDAAFDATDLRFGVHSGPVIGNVVASRTPRYSVFGETVSTALWMATNSEHGKLHCSRTVHSRCVGWCLGKGYGVGLAKAEAGGGSRWRWRWRWDPSNGLWVGAAWMRPPRVNAGRRMTRVELCCFRVLKLCGSRGVGHGVSGVGFSFVCDGVCV